jgi:hypothetical protein
MALHDAKIVVSWYEFKKHRGDSRPMTQMDAVYRYGATPTEAEMRAIDNLRDVYGIRRISFNEKESTMRVEYDASRFKEPVLASLLRRAGIDIQEKLVLA